MDWGDVFADMGFWYGIGWREAGEMPVTAIEAYMARLPKIKAQYEMMLVRAAMAPVLRRQEQQMYLRDLREQIARGEKRAAPAPAMLARIGIGVEMVK